MNGETGERRGSVWRRWDPHVHLPGTVLNDQFGDTTIQEALDLLADCDPAIEVLGITDYATTASFRRAQDAWRSGSGSSIRMLFPNVELRLDVPTAKGRGVNVHLISAAEDVDDLDRFVGLLEFSFQDRPFRADSDSLVALGRAFTGNDDLSVEAALREGTNQFKVDFAHLRQRLKTDAWAREFCLVGFAGGETDGTSGVRALDGAFEARRQEIERLAHIIFSGNPKQRLFWLGQGADGPDKLREKYGGQKLCLHGSDAHSVADLGNLAEDRFCWLRGDTSFETLQQACLVPETRAAVGADSPDSSEAHGRIAELAVSSSGWFSEEALPINSGLVAVIGARGSGKTALVDLLAAGAGSRQPFDNRASFISRADDLVNDTVVATEWTDGAITTTTLQSGLALDDPGPPPVRYLSQQFVDRLCAVDGVSDTLRHEIERVVFDAWPAENRLGATGFDELLAYRLQSARSRQDAELEAIASITGEITTQRLLQGTLEPARARLDAYEKEAERLQNEAGELTKKTDKTSAERLGVVASSLERREGELQEASRKLLALEALQSEVRVRRSAGFSRLSAALREDNAAAGLDPDDWDAFRVDFVGDVDGVISVAKNTVEAKRKALAGSTDKHQALPRLVGVRGDALVKRTVAELRSERSRLQQLVGLDERRTKRLATITERSGRVRAERAKLATTIASAERAPDRISQLGVERLEHYESRFDALLQEERELNDLYIPLERILAGGSGSVSKLNFAVRRNVDVESWARAGEELLDLRTEGPFRGRGGLERLAKAELVPAWLTGDGADAASAIREFSKKYSTSLREHSNADRRDEDAYREWERGVSEWLYGTNHVTLRYSLEYDGLDITRLSPGTRGIVLLLLYLAVDEEETVPLIIDQPEENLDPESVYAELVDLFRKASYRRQVIMVTHNANLVVNTDVDQVIVASCTGLEVGKLPNLTYMSGGLENPEIRAAVCQVLEGGEVAFRERARRLRVAW